MPINNNTNLRRNFLRNSLKSFYDFIESMPGMIWMFNRQTSKATATVCDLGPYETKWKSSGAGTTQEITLGAATTVKLGHRKLVTFDVETTGADIISLDHANILNAAGAQATNVDLSAAGAGILFEWTGTKWQVIRTVGTVAIAP